MRPYFTVVDNAALALVNKFNGVLHCNYVVFPHLVGVIDDRGQRCGFPASSRACNQYQSLLQHRKLLAYRRKAELLNAQYVTRNLSEDCCHSVFLTKKIGTVACKSRYFITEVDVTGLFK